MPTTKRKSPSSQSLPLLGAHMSIAGGVHRAIERGASIGCQTIQIFLKSNVQWRAADYTPEEVRAFRDLRQSTGIDPVFAHSCYLINLASPDHKTFGRSLAAVLDELHRAEQLGVPFIVLHPGSHMGRGEDEGSRHVAEALRAALAATADSSVKIALETTAGQGSNLGYCFEHLARLIEMADASERLAVCVDTCHLFAAGYDIRTTAGCKKVFTEFDRIIGFERLAAMHLNDSKGECGSRIDRHEHIGKGKLGLAAFRAILNDPRFQRVPMVLETPKGENLTEDVKNLRVLRRLCQVKQQKF